MVAGCPVRAQPLLIGPQPDWSQGKGPCRLTAQRISRSRSRRASSIGPHQCAACPLCRQVRGADAIGPHQCAACPLCHAIHRTPPVCCLPSVPPGSWCRCHHLLRTPPVHARVSGLGMMGAGQPAKNTPALTVHAALDWCASAQTPACTPTFTHIHKHTSLTTHAHTHPPTRTCSICKQLAAAKVVKRNAKAISLTKGMRVRAEGPQLISEVAAAAMLGSLLLCTACGVLLAGWQGAAACRCLCDNGGLL